MTSQEARPMRGVNNKLRYRVVALQHAETYGCFQCLIYRLTPCFKLTSLFYIDKC